MYNTHAVKKCSMEIKKQEMKNWKYDIDSYHRTKKMMNYALEGGKRDTTWYTERMQNIKDRWPNVKNWD